MYVMHVTSFFFNFYLVAFQLNIKLIPIFVIFTIDKSFNLVTKFKFSFIEFSVSNLRNR